MNKHKKMNSSNWNELNLDLLLTSDYLQARGHLLSTQSQTCPSTEIPDSHNKHILNLITLDSAKKVKLKKKKKKEIHLNPFCYFSIAFSYHSFYILNHYIPPGRMHIVYIGLYLYDVYCHTSASVSIKTGRGKSVLPYTFLITDRCPLYSGTMRHNHLPCRDLYFEWRLETHV